MVLKKIMPVFMFVALIAATTLIAFAAEEVTIDPGSSIDKPTEPAVSVAVSSSPAPLQNENDTQWAWGEVVNLDSAGKVITLKYLDYETDQEKDMLLIVDEKTTFENIKDFAEIKVKDTLSIDYTVLPDGKNVAKNIGLESPDSSAAVPAQVVEGNKSGAVVEEPAAAAKTPEPSIQQ
ncbi:MAG: hypothetical protein PHO40_04250 [Candidatus Omnitrophica bacterium]|jgi:hypothetical protein|nr:hypothetical protein [Candidatus Omnitrophota bacterium]